jgi:enediyne polyketide synthase
VHGRVGLRAPRPVAIAGAGKQSADPGQAGRFTERVLVHYPGVELIAEATVNAKTDPYLTDYVADGTGLLPPTVAIEAMAQAASALAGTPMRSVSDVSMAEPIVLAGKQPSAVLRLCALTVDDAVTVILRADSTGFAVDHFLATFREEAAMPDRADGGEPQATGAIKARELYGPVCFQAGRFKRLATVQFASSKAATGVLDSAAEEAWFGGLRALLGSPAMTDAALQLAQACVPHRRLMFSGWSSASFAGCSPAGVVQLHATQVDSQAATALVPAQRTVGQAAGEALMAAGQTETSWDVDAVDSAGQLVACFRGLVMREAGYLPRTSAWPVALAGSFIERAAAELGLGPGLEVRFDRRSTALGRQNADRWVRPSAADVGPPGLVLRVRADRQVACGWRILKQAGRRNGATQYAERWLDVVDGQRVSAPGGTGAVNWAKAMAIASCAGQDADPRDMSVEVRPVAGTDWLLVRAENASMMCAVIDLAGAGHQVVPVAIAVMTGVLERALAALGSS